MPLVMLQKDFSLIRKNDLATDEIITAIGALEKYLEI